jgi:chromosome segregation ATPase
MSDTIHDSREWHAQLDAVMAGRPYVQPRPPSTPPTKVDAAFAKVESRAAQLRSEADAAEAEHARLAAVLAQHEQAVQSVADAKQRLADFEASIAGAEAALDQQAATVVELHRQFGSFMPASLVALATAETTIRCRDRLLTAARKPVADAERWLAQVETENRADLKTLGVK